MSSNLSVQTERMYWFAYDQYLKDRIELKCRNERITKVEILSNSYTIAELLDRLSKQVELPSSFEETFRSWLRETSRPHPIFYRTLIDFFNNETKHLLLLTFDEFTGNESLRDDVLEIHGILHIRNTAKAEWRFDPGVFVNHFLNKSIDLLATEHTSNAQRSKAKNWALTAIGIMLFTNTSRAHSTQLNQLDTCLRKHGNSGRIKSNDPLMQELLKLHYGQNPTLTSAFWVTASSIFVVLVAIIFAIVKFTLPEQKDEDTDQLRYSQIPPIPEEIAKSFEISFSSIAGSANFDSTLLETVMNSEHDNGLRALYINAIREPDPVIRGNLADSLILNAPASMIPYHISGRARMLSGEYARAIEDLTMLIGINKGQEYYYNRAICYYMLHEFEMALNDLNIAINLDSTNRLLCLTARAAVNFELENYSDAIADIDAAQDSPSNQLGWILKPVCHLNLGEIENAISWLQENNKIILNDNYRSRVHYLLGHSYAVLAESKPYGELTDSMRMELIDLAILHCDSASNYEPFKHHALLLKSHVEDSYCDLL